MLVVEILEMLEILDLVDLEVLLATPAAVAPLGMRARAVAAPGQVRRQTYLEPIVDRTVRCRGFPPPPPAVLLEILVARLGLGHTTSPRVTTGIRARCGTRRRQLAH